MEALLHKGQRTPNLKYRIDEHTRAAVRLHWLRRPNGPLSAIFPRTRSTRKPAFPLTGFCCLFRLQLEFLHLAVAAFEQGAVRFHGVHRPALELHAFRQPQPLVGAKVADDRDPRVPDQRNPFQARPQRLRWRWWGAAGSGTSGGRRSGANSGRSRISSNVARAGGL